MKRDALMRQIATILERGYRWMLIVWCGTETTRDGWLYRYKAFVRDEQYGEYQNITGVLADMFGFGVDDDGMMIVSDADIPVERIPRELSMLLYGREDMVHARIL